MYFEYNENKYPVKIIRKNNKNTYIRITNDEICVTTSYFTTDNAIKKLIKDNEISIKKMLIKHVNKKKSDSQTSLLGIKYDIIIMSILEGISFESDKIYVKSKLELNKYISKYADEIFNERYNLIYNNLNENIPHYRLRKRMMKSKWGVCNRLSKTITLNTHLIEYRIEVIDYVIIHELAHLVHFNHSKSFWNLVAKYCPDYKLLRKELKE
jgi:predicted metal-dependent hydrolase